MTPEGKVKADIKKWLHKHKVWYFMPAANGFGKAGIPDIIICHDGRFIAVETKAPGKIDNLTENQKLRIGEINHAGGVAFVVDSEEGFVRRFCREFEIPFWWVKGNQDVGR